MVCSTAATTNSTFYTLINVSYRLGILSRICWSPWCQPGCRPRRNSGCHTRRGSFLILVLVVKSARSHFPITTEITARTRCHSMRSGGAYFACDGCHLLVEGLERFELLVQYINLSLQLGILRVAPHLLTLQTHKSFILLVNDFTRVQVGMLASLSGFGQFKHLGHFIVV
jgi:hypothetical protein